MRGCRHKIAPGRSVWPEGDPDLFARAQRKRCARLLKQFLNDQVEADLRNLVVEAVQRDLDDLGIQSQTLLSLAQALHE